MKKEIVFLAWLLVCHAGLTFAQPGTLDKTFSSDGKVTTNFGAHDFGRAVAIQPDGKIVVAGYSENNFVLARYDSSGNIDNAFGTNGQVITNLGGGLVIATSIVIQQDGKILVAGSRPQPTGSGADFALVRYNTIGTLDLTFGGGDGKVFTDFGANDYCESMVLQPNGKIVLGGWSDGPNKNAILARYNTNGTLDNTFDADGKVNTNFGGYDGIHSLAIQNGKIVATGESVQNGVDKVAVARYNSNGSLDNTFSGGGLVLTGFGSLSYYSHGSVVIQPDGKILVAANVDTKPNDADFAILRYNSNGTLDNTFGTGGVETFGFGTFNDFAYGMAIQQNGKIVVVGYSEGPNKNRVMARLNSNGAIDNGFGTNGKVITDFGGIDQAFSVAIQHSNGKIVVAGNTDNGTGDIDFAIARYLGDAVLTSAVATENISAATDEKLSTSSTIKLSPNPAKDILSIDGMDASSTKIISIVDMNGRTVQTTTTVNSTYTWNIASLPAGAYYLLIDGKKKKTNLKFVKE